MFIFRAGLPIAVPYDYASDPQHVAIVEALNGTNSYREAVSLLDNHVVGWLAADVLSGAGWAQRFLNTTAKLHVSKDAAERALALVGMRALLHVLSGTRQRVGRSRAEPLHPEHVARGAAAIAHWRSVVDACWPQERPDLALSLTEAVGRRFRLSRAHARALGVLMRRKRLRKTDVVMMLASAETGLPVRRLRIATPVADLVYG